MGTAKSVANSGWTCWKFGCLYNVAATVYQPEESHLKLGPNRSLFFLLSGFGRSLFSRELAESSPYFEAFKRQGHEVLFCYAEYDELTLLQLREFDRKLLTSVESEMAMQNAGTETGESETGS